MREGNLKFSYSVLSGQIAANAIFLVFLSKAHIAHIIGATSAR